MINIKFLIVDGHSLAYRGYHAVKKNLTAPDGTPTTMIMAFMNMLYKVQDEILPDCIIAVFDAGKKTFRHELLSDYKADRKITPEDLRIQIPILQELLSLSGHKVIMREGIEADDLAASIAKLAKTQGHNAIILSSDKDLLQLLGNGVEMLRPNTHGISDAAFYNTENFQKEYGFMPSSMSDYLAILGDKVDNIEGIEGLGEKRAKKLLAEFPTLEDIFASLDKISSKQIKTKLEVSGSERPIWLRDNIIKLKDNIFDDDENFLEECLNFKPDIEKAQELAARLGLKRVLKRLGSDVEIEREFVNDERNFEIKIPECDIFTRDYKSELKNSPEKFQPEKSVWDLKTAYYLLHPDETGKNFEKFSETVTDENFMNTAGKLEDEILSYEGLHNVMTEIDLPLIPVLNQMEDHGVRIDFEKFSVVQNELQEKIFAIENEIFNETGATINVNSPQQVSWLLFERLKFEPEGMTKGKKSFSTDANVLEKLSKLPNGKIPALILEHRELSKMLTGFVIPLQKAAVKDGTIHTTFEPAFTGTGRLSSRDPNLQNIPAFGQWAEKIKSGLIPVNPENIFISADYSQIELRVLAYMSCEEKLIEAFQNNRDIHTETAAWVFDTSPEFVTPELRRAAKMINFGLLYGMSSFGLAERLNVSRNEAKEIMKKYFDALPGIEKFLEHTVNTAKANGYSRTLAGRIRRVNEIPAKGPALDRALINSPIQGTAADIARTAMINFSHEVKGKLFLQVHDSLVCECSKNDAEKISEILSEIMKSSGGALNLGVQVKIGSALSSV